MWCLVSQPNSSKNTSMVIEVRLSHKATGQECLNQVCQKLDIIESDYFGLQFKTPKGEDIWLNLRNEIRQETCAHSFRASTDVLKSPVLRFQLKVKFWVPPHLILQDTTRHQFYLQAKIELLAGNLIPKDTESALHICALIAQAEMGDFTGMSSQTELYLNCLPNFPWSANPVSNSQFVTAINLLKGSFKLSPDYTKEDWISRVLNQHQSLKGMSSNLAEYWLLKEVSSMEGFGTEHFWGRWVNNNTACLVAVGPQGVTISCLETEQALSVPFSSIQAATNSNSRFLLKHRNDKGLIETSTLKLETYHASIALYRSITEKHAFYSCETVRSAVTSQFVRDLKGTIASFFNENTDLGKKYVFDIQRTCREVYDNARRTLYQVGDSQRSDSMLTSFDSTPAPCSDPSCQDIREQINRMQEVLLCRICMDNDIEVAFCPCGHAVACSSCAERCDQGCPVCRASFSHVQTIFLPFTSGNSNLVTAKELTCASEKLKVV